MTPPAPGRRCDARAYNQVFFMFREARKGPEMGQAGLKLQDGKAVPFKRILFRLGGLRGPFWSYKDEVFLPLKSCSEAFPMTVLYSLAL